MDRRDIADLLIFQAVVEAGSFTRAASRMGRAQSGLSQAVGALEARLGITLLARSTRSVRPTEVGQRLLQQVAPALRQIESGLSEIRQERGQPSGTLRLTAMEYPARAILVPALSRFLARHPGVKVDLHVSDRFTDVVKGGFDAGIRFGTHLEKDMVAVPVGPDMKAAIVAAPAYYARRGYPNRLDDLAAHDCLNYRTASHGDLFRWMFHQRERTIEIPVQGPADFNDAPVMIEAALAGLGLAYTFESHVAEHLSSGRLEPCLAEFCPIWSGYHLYYPSRSQKSAALSALVELLRYRRQR
ncbi:LysR family transcriptional regulator [Paracoccus sp. TOH]|uniref:LysR family transcriptional regulator n=1 Tax=Paracoccus sp. TOH TaxID=1263728 RepID=UPI0025B06D7D|nr:LysR family transcriptional regulator [Paracoccus sp. TOH]WJS85599.1 LysR family transcriptional regulator [Paracoccus sp. TOH]